MTLTESQAASGFLTTTLQSQGKETTSHSQDTHCDQARSLPDTPVLYEEGKTPASKFQVWKGNSRELQLTSKWSKWMNSYLCFRETVQKQYTSHFTPKHTVSQLHLHNSRKTRKDKKTSLSLISVNHKLKHLSWKKPSNFGCRSKNDS